ncbi:MAG: metal-transporting ATPase, partial [Lachnospiraceae bacterium]|nr:metal-transporting ATPase [Candidatus Equihabitans merdae]
QPKVTDIIPAGGIKEANLLRYAYSLEIKSEHPLAKAINDYAVEKGITPLDTTAFTVASGNGLSAVMDGKKAVGGNRKYIAKVARISREMSEKVDQLSGEGKTPLLFALDGKLMGIIAVADVIKEDSAEAIRRLKQMGIYTVMLTGDNEKTAKAIGALAGVDEVVAGVLPSGKEAVITKLMEHGKVAMVGDGINDAPALTRADTGIAIGAGTDVAIDAADVVVMKSNLTDVAAAIRLSRQTLKNIHENLFWAFFYNVIGIPLAAGCYVKLFGWSMNPMFGAAAMSLSSFCVVTNALRLNLFKLYDKSKYAAAKKLFNKEEPINGPLIHQEATEDKEATYKEENMARVFKVEGMMCPHCEKAVKRAVEALAEGIEVVADHTACTVTVTGADDIDIDAIKAAVESEDFTFVGEE